MKLGVGMKKASSAEDEARATTRVVRLDNGIKYEKVAAGSETLAAAEPGDIVTFDYVLRRSNGYFVYSTIEGVSFQPRDLPVEPVVCVVGDGNLIEGIDTMLVGMRPGDRYRILIPPALAYANDPKKLSPQPPGYAAQRQLLVHRNEPFLFEVDIVRVKKTRATTPSSMVTEDASSPL